MGTKAIKMGEAGTGVVKPRDMSNTAKDVRDNGAEFLRQCIITKLELITTNEVDDKEQMEGLVGEAVSGCYLLLRALEKVGANTSPENELRNRLKPINMNHARVPA